MRSGATGDTAGDAARGGEARLSLGLLGGAVAVTIWAGWIVATRAAMTDQLSPTLLAVARYGVPALVLAPVWLCRGIVPSGVPLGALVLMTLGWGAPFVFLTAEGLKTVPAALFGPLVPGLAPIIVAMLAWAVDGERPRPSSWIGLGLLAGALAAILGQWAVEGDLLALRGVPFLLTASFDMSVYAVAFRRSRMTPAEATAYVALYSLPLLGVALVLTPGAFDGVTMRGFAWQLLIQGLLAGVVASFAYGMALRHLGVARGSTANALVPVCAALAGMAFLGEELSVLDWFAVAAASLGVAVVNGVFGWLAPRRRRRQAPAE